MIQSPWVETVFAPAVSWSNERPLEPFVPFEVAHPIRFGPRGSDAELEWSEHHQLQLSPGPGGILFADSRDQGVTPSLIAVRGICWRPPLILRVLSSPHESAGWPRTLARPPAPWSDQTLSVLGDQFLERGLSVGQRFLSRDPLADLNWSAALTGLPAQDAVIIWRRGVMDALTVRGRATPEFGRALALQAVSVPLRQLRIVCSPEQCPAFLGGLISGGGLPCLEWFRFEVVQPAKDASELRRLPGFAEAFPALTSFEVEQELPSPRPYPVVG